MVFVKKK